MDPKKSSAPAQSILTSAPETTMSVKLKTPVKSPPKPSLGKDDPSPMKEMVSLPKLVYDPDATTSANSIYFLLP